MSQTIASVTTLDARRSLFAKLKTGDVKLVLFLLVGQFAKLDRVRRDVAMAARRWLFAGTKTHGSLIAAARRQLKADGVPQGEWSNEKLAVEIASLLADDCGCSQDAGPCSRHMATMEAESVTSEREWAKTAVCVDEDAQVYDSPPVRLTTADDFDDAESPIPGSRNAMAV